MNKSTFLKTVTAILILLISLSCALISSTTEKPTEGAAPNANESSPSGAEPTADSAPGEPQVSTDCASAPPSDYSGPAPKTGTGNLYGQLLWNGAAVPDLAIQACADANYKYECEQPIYSAISDSSGGFVIADIPPGEYEVVVHAISQEKWLDVSSLTEDYGATEIGSNQCISTGNINLIKFDLSQKSPANNAQVSEARPTLTWDAYPEAAYYELYWASDQAEPIFNHERVDTSEATPPVDVPTCQYNWKVIAFNAQSVAIAETEEFYYFYVLNQPLSCYIVGNTPASKSTVSGEGLVLSWDAHPLAAYYKIHMVRTDPSYEEILDYVQVTEPTYALEVNLGPGEYYWNIYAEDQFGNRVAGDEGNIYLTVK